MRLAPLNRSFLIFSTAGIRPRPGSGALREVVRKEERREAELALVHDAYRQDHAPRAEEVAEKKRDAPPQGFWSLQVAQN